MTLSRECVVVTLVLLSVHGAGAQSPSPDESRSNDDGGVMIRATRLTDPLRPDRFSELSNRGFVVKVNRLFRF